MNNLAMNARTTRPSYRQSEASEERGKSAPTLDEIHRRKLEIHVERGDHRCDFDEFLDKWAQAKREPREKYYGGKD